MPMPAAVHTFSKCSLLVVQAVVTGNLTWKGVEWQGGHRCTHPLHPHPLHPHAHLLLLLHESSIAGVQRHPQVGDRC